VHRRARRAPAQLSRVNAPTDAVLYGLGYAKDLDTLGFEAGEMVISPTGLPLPTADRTHRLDGAQWSALEGPPAELGKVRLPYPCIELTGTRELTQLSTATPYMAGFDDHGELWLVGPQERVAHGHPDRGFTAAPPLPFAAGQRVFVDGSQGRCALRAVRDRRDAGGAHRQRARSGHRDHRGGGGPTAWCARR